MAKGRKTQRERGHIRIYASRGHALGASGAFLDVIKDIDRDISLWTPGEGEQVNVNNALLWAHGEQKKVVGRDPCV